MKQIELPPRGLETLFGVHDQNIKHLESLLDVQINARGQSLTVNGDPKDVETVERILEDFSELFREGPCFELPHCDAVYSLSQMRRGRIMVVQRS